MLKSITLRSTMLACSLVILGGCGGPRLTEAEIGKPVFELPKLPGADQPYPMPELDKPADGAEADKGVPKPALAPKNTASQSPETSPPSSDTPSTASPAPENAAAPPESTAAPSAEPASPSPKP